MRFEEIKEILFAAAKQAGLTEYDLYYCMTDDQSAEALNGEMNSCSAGTAGGICFRCAVDGHLGAASTQSLEPRVLEGLVARAIANAAVTDTEDEPVFFGGASSEDYLAVSNDLPALPGVAELRRVAMALQKRLYAENSMMTDGTTSAAGASRTVVALANSKGLSLCREVGGVYTYVEPIIHDGSEPSFGSAMAAAISSGRSITRDPQPAKRKVQTVTVMEL